MRYAAVQREQTEKKRKPQTSNFQANLFIHLPLLQTHSLLPRRVRILEVRRLRLLGLRGRVRVRVGLLAAREQRRQFRRYSILSLGLSWSRWRRRWRSSSSSSGSRQRARGCRSLLSRLVAGQPRERRWRPLQRTVARWKCGTAGRRACAFDQTGQSRGRSCRGFGEFGRVGCCGSWGAIGRSVSAEDQRRSGRRSAAESLGNRAGRQRLGCCCCGLQVLWWRCWESIDWVEAEFRRECFR